MKEQPPTKAAMSQGGLVSPVWHSWFNSVWKAFSVMPVDDNGYIIPKTSADTDAPNNSIYYSSTKARLVYKDSSGTVKNLVLSTW